MKLVQWGASEARWCALAVITNALALSAGSAAGLMPSSAEAQTEGSVRIPLARYEALREGGDGASAGEVGYAFGDVAVSVDVSEAGEGGDARAEVTVTAAVRVLASAWTLVPLASSGAALTEATVDGHPAELVPRGGSLAWPTDAAGVHQLRWTYSVDARRYGDGRVIAIATPPASAQLALTVPGVERGVTVIPASNVHITQVGEQTRVSASLPASGAAQIAWRSNDGAGFTLSRAAYRGRLEGDTVRFDAELTVELGDARARVPLFPALIALEEVRVDRVEAAIAVEDGVFVVPVSGRGRHRIEASFQVPVSRGGGLPHVDLDITPTPVSRFELTLPGEREVTVEPLAGVSAVRRDGRTVSSFHVPMSARVAIHWAEAVPVDAEAIEVRANAEIVHVVRPDDGVLSFRAFATWAITRGTLSRVELELPPGVQVNAVESSAGVVSDWRVIEEGNRRTLGVFLDREVSDALAIEIRYERPWPADTQTSEAFDVPLVRARGVSRQRGMLALLSTRELTLEPREEEHVTRVGDNILPASIRDQLEGTVAHTWRYLDEPPRVRAIGAVSPPVLARYDAQVDTLVSLGDVSTTVTTLVDVDVKSGTLDVLTLTVPAGLNLLEVSAPSLRHYALDEGDPRTLRIELTQPMEGRFRVEVVCERITGQEEELEVPLLGVSGAEVERGRLGVEALAPFQVDAAHVERLSPIDPGELPEQLVLRTDNPILHAFRYAQADPAPRFTVRITRHEEISTPHAVVDEASYRTLYTRDGVAVTTARFMVRNRRQQSLRVALPAGSEVWSAHVDGRIETPALESGSDADAPIVLLNIVSAAQAFPVDLVYATPVARLGAFGRLGGELPRLDVVVTRTRWELYLPDGAVYADPEGSMTLLERGTALGGGGMPDMPMNGAPDDLSLDVPTEGVRYVFTKMYAGRSGERVAVAIPYVSGWGGPFAMLLSVLGALLFCLGLLAFAVVRLGFPIPAAVAERLPIALATYRDHDEAYPPSTVSRMRLVAAILGVAGFGALLLGATLGYLSTSAWPASAVVLACALGAIGMVAKQRLDARRAAAPPAAPPVESPVGPPLEPPPAA